MIKQIKHATIPVKNQNRALEFYTKKLGFELICDQEMGPQRWIELKIPHAETQIVLFTAEGQEDRIGTFSNIIFHCDNINESYEDLKQKGVEFIHPPKNESWGTYTIFKDSEGNTFCLSSN